MALKFKTYKKATIVLRQDGAVAADCDYEAYRKSYFDHEKLKLVEGGEPTKFYVEPLSQLQLDVVEQFPEGRIRDRFTVSYALHSVEGLYADNTIVDSVIPRIENQWMLSVDPAWFDKVHMTGAVLHELAEHIRQLSEPDPT